MPIFEYKAVTQTGRLMTGTIEAVSHEQAKESLSEMDLTVNEITQARKKQSKTAVGRSEFLLFNKQLASITQAGIPLDRGLRELAADVTSGSMRKLITAIAEELEGGVSIDEAIEKRQKHFPALYGEILRAGVKTGRLNEMLTSLNRHLEMAQRTRRIVFEAVSYPLVVIALTFVVVTGMFVFVIPTFAEILNDMGDGARLPWLTEFFLGVARNILPISAVFVASCAGVAVVSSLMSASQGGRCIKESILLKVPALGRLYHNSVMSRMSETMALLVGAGCDMGQCLRLASGSSGSTKLKLESEILAGQVEKGSSLLEAGLVGRMIPRLFLYSVQLGTQRNELQDNLRSLSDMYAEQTRCHQARLQTLLLPLLLIFLGGTIGITIAAMFLPIISIITCLM